MHIELHTAITETYGDARGNTPSTNRFLFMWAICRSFGNRSNHINLEFRENHACNGYNTDDAMLDAQTETATSRAHNNRVAHLFIRFLLRGKFAVFPKWKVTEWNKIRKYIQFRCNGTGEITNRWIYCDWFDCVSVWNSIERLHHRMKWQILRTRESVLSFISFNSFPSGESNETNPLVLNNVFSLQRIPDRPSVLSYVCRQSAVALTNTIVLR